MIRATINGKLIAFETMMCIGIFKYIIHAYVMEHDIPKDQLSYKDLNDMNIVEGDPIKLGIVDWDVNTHNYKILKEIEVFCTRLSDLSSDPVLYEISFEDKEYVDQRMKIKEEIKQRITTLDTSSESRRN